MSRIHNRWVKWQEARAAIIKASLKSKESSSAERVREAEQKAKQVAWS